MRERAVSPTPEHSQQRGGVPTPQEKTHFLGAISPVLPKKSCIDYKPNSAEREETRDDPVAKTYLHQRRFNTQKRGNQEFGGHSANRGCRRSPPAQAVGLDVHHFAENMRVHGKYRAK